MIDQWFKKDLQSIFEKHPVAVFIDESGDAEFLLRIVGTAYTIHTAHSEIEELHIKYLIEREQPSSAKYLIYTNTPKDDLKSVREYCETNGVLEIHYLQNYIKEKVHQTLNLNINFSEEELFAAAKVSIGKDLNYWRNLIHKGAGEIFDMEKELLPFIHDPETYSKGMYDDQLRETFYHKVNDLLEQEYISKPAQTLAGEVVKAMLDGLAYGKRHPLLELVYNNWLDSLSYRESLFRYLDSYSLPSDMNLLSVSPSHPFQTVDEKWLKEVGKNLSSKEILAHFMERVNLRIKNKQAQAFGISFWTDVKILIEFDTKDITYLSTFEDCVEFYTKHFYILDTAIRNLYTEFLNKRDLLEPFQEYYKQILSVFLDKWFKYYDSCMENQTGILQQIIDDNSTKTAIIVGDGVAYEVACQIADKVNKNFKLVRDTIIGDIPSETENNMSRIYMANAVTEKVQKKREKYLLEQNSDISIDFIKLDEVNEDARSAQFLICTYKDIDDMGEKLQQKALKYFQETIDYFAEKVSQLLSSGYSKVYLISDHGFVLTGLLSESDKISVSVEGPTEKAERYIRTMERQPSLSGSYIGVEKKTKDFNFLYFSKNMNPFKTPGVYGFSHGGITPQELVTSYFCWEHTSDSTNLLAVTFENKEDLQSVTGELFQIKIKSGKGDGGLFSEKRKVFLIFFSNNVQVNKSDIFEVEKNQLIIKEYSFDGNPEIEVQLLDAESRELLDKTTIKQNKARDLGGLL